MGFRFGRRTSPTPPGALAEDIAAGGLVLVEFAERDAPACRLQEPVLTTVQRRFGGRLRVLRADVEASPDDAAAYGVGAVPTFVLFDRGEEKLRLVGYQPVAGLTWALEEALTRPG